MNTKRAIWGPLLSIVFLLFFVYMISGVQWVCDNVFSGQSREAALGSVSGAAQNVVSENTQESALAPAPLVSANETEEPAVNAKSAISVESNLAGENRIVFEKDSDARLPIASLTKLMTAIIVLDNYNLNDNVVVSETADSQDPMKQDVKLGDTMPVESFLEIMLVESSNKSAYALSELIGEQKFVELMNQKAKDLGLQNTFFADPTGLSSDDVSTAGDLAKLAEYILKNYPKIAGISKNSNLNVAGFGNITNSDELLGEIPDVVCSKTGFTTAAKGCLLLVLDNPKNNDYLINVVLGADDRFAEMKNLISISNSVCK